VSSSADLSSRWPVPDSGLRDRLLAAYGDGSRGYHDLRHLGEVLDRLDELALAGTDYDQLAVRLAAWFHDAVYDRRPDDEERSAQWAERDLPPAGVDAVVVREVARLVRLTEQHRPADGDRNGGALSDADLAVLAAPADRYAEYVAAVRQEHAAVPDTAFAVGRAAVLTALAEKPSLFHTAYGRATWEAPARDNIARELEGLRRSPQ
jgi:predicted metal-dependent HD superfamily phosphohydrolase